MPRIPTILTDRGISGQMPQQDLHASPGAFSPDYTGLARGLFGLGSGLGNLAGDLYSIEQHRKRTDDVRWARSAAESEKMALNEWLANSTNNSKETYAQEFRDYAQDRMGKAIVNAPSNESSLMFQGELENFIGRQYGQALFTQERTRLNNMGMVVDDMISNGIVSYRNQLSVPNGNPRGEMTASIRSTDAAIMGMFGQVAPEAATKHRERLYTESVLGITPTDPAFAKEILETAPIDEALRTRLMSHVDQALKDKNLVARDEFDRLRKDVIVNVSEGRIMKPIDLATYQLFYPADRAIIEKRNDDEAIKVLDTANTTMDRIGSYNAQGQLKELAMMREDIKSLVDQETYKLTAARVQKNIDLMASDPVSWLLKNNTEVKYVDEEYKAATDEAATQRALSRRNSTIKKYQGYPPPGTDPKYAQQFLGMPSYAIKLMPFSEAESIAVTVNQGTPAEAVAAINTALAKFPDEEDKHIAFNQLSTLPANSRIKQEYQLAFQNQGAWWLDTYISAISKSKDIGSLKLTEEKRRDLEDTLMNNKSWNSLVKSMVDDPELADELSGFKEGIMSMAQLFMAQGRGGKDAINEATQLLILSTSGFTEVNGKTLVMARDGQTDEQMDDVGRRLAVALGYVDPRRIEHSNFAFLQRFPGPEGSIERMQALRDAITSRGFFMPTPDGHGATLHYRDDLGLVFQVRDKDNRPLAIYFDELPKFMQLMRHVLPKTGEITDYMQLEQPSATYDIEKYPPEAPLIDRILGTYQKKSYWPTNNAFIRNELRK